MHDQESRRSRLALALGVIGLILALALGSAYLAEAGPDRPGVRSHLDCEGISDHPTSAGAYVAGSPSLYIAGYETTESPSELADRFAAQNRLRSLAERATGSPAIAQREVFRSSHLIDLGFQTDDGRIIAVITLVDQDGWKVYGSVRCAR